MRDWFKVFVLLALALYFAINILTGNLTNYINTRFAWLSYVAVILFATLGIASANALLRGTLPILHGDRTTIQWPVIAIVALPLVFGTLIPSQPLGAQAVNGNISLTVAEYNVASAATKDPLSRNVLDWMRVFSGAATAASFDGQSAEFSGFIYREPDFPPGHVMVARFTVSCCVADASAIGLPVYWPEFDTIADGEWVQVSGTFEAGLFRDTKTPILQAERVGVIDVPEHPYLYP